MITDKNKLTEAERNLLQDIFNHFDKTSNWPNTAELNVKYRKTRGIWKMAERLGHDVIVIDDRSNKMGSTRLTIKGISFCNNSKRILQQFLRALKLCVDRYLESPSSPVISGSEIFTKLEIEHDDLNKILLLIKEERNIWTTFQGNDSISTQLTLYEKIMEYEDINTIEDYIRIAYPISQYTRGSVNSPADFSVEYPIDLCFVDEEVKELRVNRYKVLRPLSGEGYSIEFLKSHIHPDGIGAVISDTLTVIGAINLMGEQTLLSELEKIILAVRAHNKINFFELSKQLGGRHNELVITSDNYGELIDRTEESRIVKRAILRTLFTFFNSDSRAFLDTLSIYCSIPYQISSIIRNLILLADIGDIIPEDVYSDSVIDSSYRLNPSIYKDLERELATKSPSAEIRPPLEQNSEYQYDFFICHATEDKTPFVANMANALITEGFKVWYDEISLNWGDKLRRSIEKGLSSSRYGIVVLSNNFFQKEWPQRELDALFVIEGSSKRILPVWLNITKEEVQQYSPLLADRIAIKSEQGVSKIIAEARKLGL